LADRRDLRIARAIEERLPRPGLARPDDGFELELDREEARLLGELNQVALVEVEHRVARRLDLRVDLLHAFGQVGDAVARIAPEALRPLLHAESVDRLKAGKPAARPQDAEELGERPRL